jgi:hypothetical protein
VGLVGWLVGWLVASSWCKGVREIGRVFGESSGRMSCGDVLITDVLAWHCSLVGVYFERLERFRSELEVTRCR